MPPTKHPQGLAVSVFFTIAILGIVVVGFIVHDIANGCLFSKCPTTPVSSVAQHGPSAPSPLPPAKTVAWDGNPNHADCSPGGHPDPKHPGDLISDEDEGDDKPCIPNASIPPPVDPLADGAAPDAAHCFGSGWGTLPDATEGDRKCNPMRQRQLVKDERVQKVFGETASHARWVDAPDTKPGDLDEFYELPGEDGQNACAEVTHSAQGDDAYTISVLNANHDVRMSTQHMAELAAVSVCGNGRHP
jgi:hypothetical protein